APAQSPKVWKERATLKGHTDAVLSVSFGDEILATASHDDTVKLWDLVTSKELEAFRPHPKSVDPDNTPVGLGWVQFRLDGKQLAMGGGEGGGTVNRDFSRSGPEDRRSGVLSSGLVRHGLQTAT